MRIFFLLLFLVNVGFSQAFTHPDRFEHVSEVLKAKGIDPLRIKALFASKKAHWHDKKSFAMIADRSKIKAHRKAEQRANQQILLKEALLKRHLKKYKKVYDQVEARYRVNREIIAAILQKETALGAFKAYKYDAFSVLCAMLDRLSLPKFPKRWQLRRFHRLKKFAEDNLVALILYYENEGVDILKTKIRSSYAGAIGIPQFTPQHFDLIVTAPGEHNRSLHYMPTAIFSTANLLTKRFGWHKMINFEKIKSLDTVIAAWYRFDKGDANFIYEKNLDGMVVPNFVKSHPKDKQIRYAGEIVRVLKRYNFSTAYALGILQIALESHEG